MTREQLVKRILVMLLDEKLFDEIDLGDMLNLLTQHQADNAAFMEATGEQRSIRIGHYLKTESAGAELGDSVKYG